MIHRVLAITKRHHLPVTVVAPSRPSSLLSALTGGQRHPEAPATINAGLLLTWSESKAPFKCLKAEEAWIKCEVGCAWDLITVPAGSRDVIIGLSHSLRLRFSEVSREDSRARKAWKSSLKPLVTSLSCGTSRGRTAPVREGGRGAVAVRYQGL